jgi:hypothetical protein
MTTDTYRYRGYYATRADLPLMSRSTLHTLESREEDAVVKAKKSIDRILSRLDH